MEVKIYRCSLEMPTALNGGDSTFITQCREEERRFYHGGYGERARMACFFEP